MTRRRGLSLIEVLTALFIMGVGTIAILTMFPLGAVNMANANRDDRSTLAAFGADQYFRTYWRTTVSEVPEASINEQFFAALNDPDGSGSFPALATNSTEVSYPVFVDPMGFVARGSSPFQMVGDASNTGIGRRNLLAVTNAGGLANQTAQRLCSLMDSIGSDNGVPNTDRELRYNFLWVIQRPNNSQTKTVNLTVVVFDRRANLFAPPGSEQVILTPNNGTVPGTTSVTFTSAPDIKPGAWIMDGSINVRAGLRHANFYRVTAVDGNTVELQSPIKTASDGSNNPYTGTFVILRGVSGVYEKGKISSTD